MELAWNQGYRKSIIEIDSQTITVQLNSYSPDETNILLGRIPSLKSLPWMVSFVHTFHDGNECVDWLVNCSLSSRMHGVQVMTIPMVVSLW